MEKETVCTLENEGFRAYWFPGTKAPGRAVISVGASSCDEKTSVNMAGFLRKAGWNVLVLGYYHWKGLPETLCGVPLDYAEKAVKWLRETQNITKIAMTGVSEGADYALCCAERLPEISCVIPVVPYDCIIEATSGGLKRLHASPFTWHGESLPYTALALPEGGLLSCLRRAKTDGFETGRLLRWVYEQTEKTLNPASRIRVENMNADVLLLGVKDDDCWPSDRAVPRMAELLKNSGYPHRVGSFVYERASHALMDGLDAMSGFDRYMVKQSFPAEKKHPAECDAARRDSFRRITDFLDAWDRTERESESAGLTLAEASGSPERKEKTMKTVIVYFSAHHGNTKKLADAVAEKNEVVLIDAARQKTADLSEYDRIGFASGIDCGKFYPQMLKFMEENLPENRKVFFLYTYGMKRGGYTDAAAAVAAAKRCEVIGEYGCLGFDTFGPLKLVGGIAKGHPTAEEIAAAADFYDSLK